VKPVSRIFYFFTPYTDAREQSVGRFFRGLNERGNKKRVRRNLLKLSQKNLAAINLWTEYRYKGYEYLNKSQRRKLYDNIQLIAADFDAYYQQNARATTTADDERIRLISALMGYFSPRRGVFQYRESSSFGRLLRDPSKEKLVGDCNQIVTLYIYLYSRYFDIRDLQLRVLPGHVALHYSGQDIETTNGTFMDYSKRKGNMLLPVEEIVSINLLDITDSYLATHEIAPGDLLQASRLAFVLSHDRDLVASNLEAAYSRMVNSLMANDDYTHALAFAKASRSSELIGIVGHNGAVFELERHHYAAARRFAKHAPKKDELTRNSWQSEGFEHYQAHHYHDAIKAFKHTGDKNLVRRCYEALYFEEQTKLGPHLTADTIRSHRRAIGRMRTYAKKSGNKQLTKHADSLRKYL
jgi:hypothetical protein